jgi:hypothetical protein
MSTWYVYANVHVKSLPSSLDQKDDTTFSHHLGSIAEKRAAAELARDVRSEPLFWVIQQFGAYEGDPDKSFDPEPQVESELGHAIATDGPCVIFTETIRDVREWNAELLAQLSLDPPAAVNVLIERIAHHESVHKFGISHGGPGGDEGPLGARTPMSLDSEFELTPTQIRKIQACESPIHGSVEPAP